MSSVAHSSARLPTTLARRLDATRRRMRALPRASAYDPKKGIGTDAVDLACPDVRDKLTPHRSPFSSHNNLGGGFVSDEERVVVSAVRGSPSADEKPALALRAGARETIYFDPKRVTAAIVTCGGLCPGLNDVVHGIVNKLFDYGVRDGCVLGVRYGFRGFYSKTDKPVSLTRRSVDGIQLRGGTILGTSRGGADLRRIARKIDMWGVNMVFVVGGNGGNAGAAALQRELHDDDVDCVVIGVPKSIDNDISIIDKTFGFDTAVEEAQRALIAAKVEASSAYRGIGIVKLMGRQSGFIAMQASMASGVVDACLIPEVRFELGGDRGVFSYVSRVLDDKGHAVLCVAEGAGQDALSGGRNGVDASGNPKLEDVGTWLKDEMKTAFPDSDVKYIDPSYLVRSTPANAGDRIYCKVLAHNAVHAAFSGYAATTVGLVNSHHVYLPMSAVVRSPRTVDPRGKSWNRLRASIGQPDFF
jgi:6-phosphofructokinase 1